jgi:hypothetical protein
VRDYLFLWVLDSIVDVVSWTSPINLKDYLCLAVWVHLGVNEAESRFVAGTFIQLLVVCLDALVVIPFRVLIFILMGEEVVLHWPCSFAPTISSWSSIVADVCMIREVGAI